MATANADTSAQFPRLNACSILVQFNEATSAFTAGRKISQSYYPLPGNDPATTIGHPYAPFMIERFTEVQGDTLKILYTMSTWNPCTIVKMESDFRITRAPLWPF
jgi:hypothetical protein